MIHHVGSGVEVEHFEITIQWHNDKEVVNNSQMWNLAGNKTGGNAGIIKGKGLRTAKMEFALQNLYMLCRVLNSLFSSWLQLTQYDP